MVHYFSHKKLSYVERVSNGNGSNKFEELFLSRGSNFSSTPIACFHAKANSYAWRGRKKTVRVGMSRGSAPQNGVPLHRLWNIIHLTKRWTEKARARGCGKTLPSWHESFESEFLGYYSAFQKWVSLKSHIGTLEPCCAANRFSIVRPLRSPRQISTTNWMSSVHFKWRLACPILRKSLLHP